MDGLVVGAGSLIPPPNELSEALDSDLKFTTTGTEGATWSTTTSVNAEYYYDADAMQADKEGQPPIFILTHSDFFVILIACQD